MSTDHPGDEPKLHVDSDWKAEVQAERELLAEKEVQKQDESPQADPSQPGELPPANFKGLVGILASQAIMGLGSMKDPESGGVVVDLVGAKFAIDLLAVLEEKTKGNLEQEEESELKQILTELQSRFVQIAQLVAAQAQGGMQPPSPDGSPLPSLEIPGQ